jgi:hypothetical protein
MAEHYAFVTYVGGGRSRRIRRDNIYFWRGVPTKVTDSELISFFKRKPETFHVVEYGIDEKPIEKPEPIPVEDDEELYVPTPFESEAITLEKLESYGKTKLKEMAEELDIDTLKSNGKDKTAKTLREEIWEAI